MSMIFPNFFAKIKRKSDGFLKSSDFLKITPFFLIILNFNFWVKNRKNRETERAPPGIPFP